MLRRVVTCAAVFVVLATGSVASAHDPGTDGGTAQRGCTPVQGGRIYVGATRVSCSIARQVAAGSVRGRRFERWVCTGLGSSFGHCHGRGVRRGAIVHWAVND